MDKILWTEVGISALIAFVATFAGVYLAFWMEQRRAAAEETEQFGQILNGVLNESANNVAMLNEIREKARGGTTLIHEVFTETLQIALGSPVFYRKAGHSLVMAARLVRTHLGKMSNLLSLYRQAAAGGREMAHLDAQGLKVRAEASIEFINVLQELVVAAMNQVGVAVIADPEWEGERKRLAAIYDREREQLEKLGLWWPVDLKDVIRFPPPSRLPEG